MNNEVKKSARNERKYQTRRLAITGMLSAVTMILSATPLGFIPIGIFNVTTVHIPVIIGAVLEGPLVGAIIGLVFGLSSWFKHLTAPGTISFIFWNPLISVLPRVLIGVLSGYFYKLLSKTKWNRKILYFATGILGTFVNTFFVLGGAYLLYASQIAERLSPQAGAAAFLIGIATANGVPEMLVSAIITLAVASAVEKTKK